MTAARSPANRLPLGLAVLVSYQVGVSMIDFGKIGLKSDGPDFARLLVLAPAHIAIGVALLALSPEVGRALRRMPMAAMGAWFTWGAISVIWSLDAAQTAINALAAFSLWITAVWVVRRAGAAAYARLFCFGAAPVLVGGVIFDLTDPDTADPFTGRLSGLTASTNLVSAFAALTIVFAVVAARAPGSRWTTACGVVALVPLVSGGSRSATFFLLVAMAVLLVVDPASPVRRWAAGAGLVVVGSIGVAALSIDGVRSGYEVDRDLGSLTDRDVIWDEAIDLIAARPVLGTGAWGDLGSWLEAYFRTDIGFEAFNAHNIGLELLVTTGVVGLVLFSVAVGWTVVAAWTRRDAGAGAILIVLLGIGLTEAIIDAIALFGALGAAMAMVGSTVPTGRSSRSWSRSFDEPAPPSDRRRVSRQTLV